MTRPLPTKKSTQALPAKPLPYLKAGHTDNNHGFTRYRRPILTKELRDYLGWELSLSFETDDAIAVAAKYGEVHAEAEHLIATAQDLINRGITAEVYHGHYKDDVLPVVEAWKERDEREYAKQVERESMRPGKNRLRTALQHRIRALSHPGAFTATPDVVTHIVTHSTDAAGSVTDDSEDMHKKLWTGSMTDLEAEMSAMNVEPGDPNYDLIVHEIARLWLERTMKRLAEISFPTKPSATPPVEPEVAPATSSGAATCDTIIELWAKRSNPSAKSKHQYAAHLKKLLGHLGLEDAARVAEADIEGWIDALLDAGESQANTMTRINCVKTLFKAAAKRKLIPSNPAANIEFKAKYDPLTKKGKYTREQAKLILLAARDQDDPVKRWVPWAGAFTGARLGEVCGATTSDVYKVDGVWVFHIDPQTSVEGETVKNRESERDVPIHPALIAEGFITYMQGLPAGGPLFPNLPPDKWGKRSGVGSKRISRWIRGDLGITAKNIQPSHSWRRFFINACIAVEMNQEHRFALEGHSTGTVSEKHYQDAIPTRLLYKSICLLPDPTK